MARCTSHSVVRLSLGIHSGYIQASPTLDLVRDYIRFVIAFFEVINTSAPHIFHSALPLSPQTSIISRMYNQHAAPFVRVVQGTPFSWEPAVATAYLDNFEGEAVWSPCNRFIAVIKRESVEVLDAVTLSRLHIFGRCPSTVPGRWLGFSSDSRCLSLVTSLDLDNWDLQTGGPLGTTRFYSWGANIFSFTYSEDGEMLAVVFNNLYFKDIGDINTTHNRFICTYDLSSRTQISPRHALDREGLLIYPIWTRDKRIRFATIKPGLIIMWEAEFTLIDPPVETTRLPVPDDFIHARRFLFLPSPYRLAFVLGGTIQIWDFEAPPKLLFKSELTLQSPSNEIYSPCGSFSSDGRFFAYTNTGGEVYVLKESPAGYLFHQQFTFPTSISPQGPQLSPNGESIIIPLGSKIHLWHTRNQVPPLPSASTD